MKKVKQRTQSDCFIAALATATGASYKAVKGTFGDLRGGVELHEAKWIAAKFGNWRFVRFRNKRTVASFIEQFPFATAILWLEPRTIGTDDGHAIVVENGEVYDPSSPNGFGISLLVYYAFISI
jgi:hypothetical protein